MLPSIQKNLSNKTWLANTDREKSQLEYHGMSVDKTVRLIYYSLHINIKLREKLDMQWTKKFTEPSIEYKINEHIVISNYRETCKEQGKKGLLATAGTSSCTRVVATRGHGQMSRILIIFRLLSAHVEDRPAYDEPLPYTGSVLQTTIIFKLNENCGVCSKRVENTVVKREIARHKQFLLFPTVFSKDLYCRHVKTRDCLGKG